MTTGRNPTWVTAPRLALFFVRTNARPVTAGIREGDLLHPRCACFAGRPARWILRFQPHLLYGFPWNPTRCPAIRPVLMLVHLRCRYSPIVLREKSHFKRESRALWRRRSRGSEGHQMTRTADDGRVRLDDCAAQSAACRAANRNADPDAARDRIRCGSNLRRGLRSLRVPHQPPVAHRKRAFFMHVRNPHAFERIATAAAFFVDKFRHRNHVGRRRRLHRPVQ